MPPSARPTPSVNLFDASAVAVLTSADLTNIETGLSVREALAERWEAGAGGAAGLRPQPGPHDGAELRVPARPVDLGPGRAVVRGRGTRARRPRDLLRRPAAVPRRSGSAWPPVEASRAWPCRTCRPGPGSSRCVGPTGTASSSIPPRRGTRFQGGDQAYLLGPYDEILRVLRRDQSNGSVGTPSASGAALPDPGPTPPTRRRPGQTPRPHRSPPPRIRSPHRRSC